MSNPEYHNIFSYYTSKTKGADKNKVLETNVTKAFINVLESVSLSTCPNKGVCIKQIIDRVCRKSIICPVVSLSEMHLEVENVQNNPHIISILKPINKNNKYLILIVPKEKYSDALTRIKQGFNTKVGSTRLDALIGINGELALGIESKIDSEIRRPQLKGHLNKLGINKSLNKRIITTTWKDVYYGINSYTNGCQRTESILCNFLSKQFCEFLDSYSLKGFSGFKDEHFVFNEKELKNISDGLRRTVETLISELELELELSNLRILKKYGKHKLFDFTRQCKNREYPYIEYEVKNKTLHASQVIALSREDHPFMEVYFHVDYSGFNKLNNRLKSPNEFQKTINNFAGFNIQIYYYDKISTKWLIYERKINKIIANPKLLDSIIDKLEFALNSPKKGKWEFALTKVFSIKKALKPEIKNSIFQTMVNLDKFREYLCN